MDLCMMPSVLNTLGHGKARYASNRACYVVNNGSNIRITGGQ